MITQKTLVKGHMGMKPYQILSKTTDKLFTFSVLHSSSNNNKS